MFLEPDWYENCATLCLAQCISSAPNHPRLHCTTTQKGQSHPPSQLSQANAGRLVLLRPQQRTHQALSIFQLTRSPPQTPSPARTRVASTIAHIAHERHVARLAPAAVAVRRSTDHAQDAPGALVPACPGQAATGAPCALATRASERRAF